MKPKSEKPRYTTTIMDLIAAFAGPRRDHPGRKEGCPYRRGSHSGRQCRTSIKK